ncbi:deoxyribonuclease V [Acidovorax soli]|uniref:Deoxyribonuclease V n=1 Tax=Acidovorax soli TaxID=592050 RepID=A0A7X0UDK5_9BURK|nr:endonuclease V [Acidovorax soli]MBB6564238.1 deoxyribonuclease V [Acidovorax soli]
MRIAILDVDYRSNVARAACVTAPSWATELPLATHVSDIESVQEYEPGAFYKRELPCLLRVLEQLAAKPDVIVIDGYVWLDGACRPGLGAHLYQALGNATPVVGVAKTAFHGAETCPAVVQVRRGTSARPLFVTAVGVDLAEAAGWVRGMAGLHRIPSLLAAVDQLSRSTFETPPGASAANAVAG